MSSLHALWLEDNPIAFARLYRIDVLGCFPEAQHLLLDGRPSQRSEIEIAALRAQVSHCPFPPPLLPVMALWTVMGCCCVM